LIFSQLWNITVDSVQFFWGLSGPEPTKPREANGRRHTRRMSSQRPAADEAEEIGSDEPQVRSSFL
jgi:hypothetical protein